MTEGDILLLDENYQVYSSIIRSLNNLRLRRGYYILPTKTLKIDVREVGCQLPVAVYPFNRQLANGS